MRGQSLGLGDGGHVGRQGRQRLGAHRHRVHVRTEVVDAQRRRRSAPCARWGARGSGRPGSRPDWPARRGPGTPPRPAARGATAPRRPPPAAPGARGPPHWQPPPPRRDRPPGPSTRLDRVASRSARRGEAATILSTSASTASAACRRPRHQPGQPVGSVLGLHHHVERGPPHGSGVVGHHHDLGGTREGRRDPHDPRHLALGLGHVAVSGSHDDVHGGRRLACRRPWPPPPGRRRRGRPRRHPAMAAAASVSGATAPSGPGGTHRASSATPATRAGAAHMSTVDG